MEVFFEIFIGNGESTMNNRENVKQDSFSFIQGLVLSDINGVGEFFESIPGGYAVYPSADKMKTLAERFIDKISEPMFFFLELPKEDEALKYDVYYLECTKPVAKAVLKRYGELLINDGVSRFGFGSHKNDEEIYFSSLQTVYIYTERGSDFKEILRTLGISSDKKLSAADKFDPESDDIILVELNGETVFDMAENLKSAGLYFGSTVEY